MVRFGGYELDEAAHELRHDGRPVHLEPQAFDVLVHLVRHRDRVVPKHELLDAVWGHGFVSESALTTRIKEVRRAVGDDGTRQAVIANVRGRGYRFVAAATSGPTRPTPALAAGLVGRDDDLAGVLARLDESPLVSLVGPGGVGKTTLAAAVLSGWRRAHRSEVWEVPLAEISGADPIVAAIARATGVMVDGDDAAALAGALTERDGLLLLDNCEHVAAPVAQLVGRLLAEAPGLRILATGRERLGVSAELVWPVLPLSAADATHLFVARARAADPAVAIDADRVGVLVASLDGLPLGVEMAAAQLSTMSFDELEALVAARRDLLQSPDRGAPARHQTVAALVGWSLDLLEPTDRRTLTDLAVFAGGVTADDAAAVLAAGTGGADGPTIRTTLSGLAARSLVAADTTGPATRYRMPETVRSVVALELPAHRAQELTARHARHFLERARTADGQLRTPQEAEAHADVTALIPELRASSRWGCREDPALLAELVTALHLYTYTRLWAEPADWTRSLADRRDPVLEAALAADAAHRSRLDEARTLAERALAADDPRAAAIAHEVLSDVALYQGRLGDAARHSTELRRLAAAGDDLHLEVMGLVNLALGRAYGGDPDGAVAVLDGFVPIAAELSPSDRGWWRYADGEVRCGTDPAATLASLGEAIELAEGVGNRLLASVARVSLATGLAALGEDRSSLESFATCIREGIAHGNSTHSTTVLRNVVGLLAESGETDAATVVLAALDGEGVRGTWGSEAEQLAIVRSTLPSGAPPAVARSAATGVDGALRVALDAVDRLLER